MNEINVFDSPEFGTIRTIDRNGEPWFVGKYVAAALGYEKPQNAISAHVDNEDKTTALIQGTGSNYKSNAVLINESGLYSLVLSSKLPTAKKFKRWVTSEVIPSIRKHGGYMAGQEVLTDAELLANAMLVANRVIEDRERQIKELMEENKELEEDANYTRTILRNPGLVTTNQIAKDYGMSARTFNKLLHSMGIQYKQGKQWLLYSPYQSKGYTASKTYDFTHKDGRKDVGMLTMWTQRGRAFLYSALKDEGIVPEIEKVDLFD